MGVHVAPSENIDRLLHTNLERTLWRREWSNSYGADVDAALAERLTMLYTGTSPLPGAQSNPTTGTYHTLSFWGELVPGVKLYRSRPYPNGNLKVEQKHIRRAYLGYVRPDTVEQVNELDDLYDRMGLCYNLLRPIMRLVRKEVIREKGGRTQVRREYDRADLPLTTFARPKLSCPNIVLSCKS